MSEVKTVEELLAAGGKFYTMQGESYCDTLLATWKLIPGTGYVRIDPAADAGAREPGE